MKRWLAAVVIVLALASASPALAWNDAGHMISAFIAYRDLKPATREKVVALLREHPRYKEDLLAGMPDGYSDPDLYAFMKAATWPDMVRNRANPLQASEHHSNWHYIDYPLVVGDTEKLHAPPPEEQGGEVDNAVKAMAKVSAELGDGDIPASRQAIDLCWLEHLTGDLHQPEHAVSLFTPELPTGDKGGNLITVRKPSGESLKLHALWDEMLGKNLSAAEVEQAADVIRATPALSREALHTALTDAADPVAWAKESFAIAKEAVYQDGKLVSDLPKAGTTILLPQEYLTTGEDVAKRRIALAGYRLADQLNARFTGAKASNP